ncbi:LOW QUALITY PROTEIN: uncharacterized protein EMH_0035260 [Eimeria mitis]|uniref:Trimethylguanosine synthase n=1 Tax=Eimeria mitis TaxID=44415 RepID=U6JWG1_9EIME|nr:LOW QUALITY PROTEIN: uncharacterized protein EMH_0035260 [Eimeria mitis]CDJ27833.1 hypothetical protein, conserved [Eimeria mitis]
MEKGSALQLTDVLSAEVWAYTPPQGTEGVFTGKRQRVRSKQEQRESRRRELFSKFDEGIQLDEEMWWSVTPEQLAVHTAERCRCDLILDGFAGAGGNTIAFARSCGFVISCEIDPVRIEIAKANAAVYGTRVFRVVCLLRPSLLPPGEAQVTTPGRPRSVCLLPLLRAAALFALRRDAARRGAASTQGGNDITTSSPAAHVSENTAANGLPGNCDGEEAPACPTVVPRMRIELALCRSRRDAGNVSFEQLCSYEGLAHLASCLCRVVWKARPRREESPADSADEQEEEPNPKRRRINSAGSAGQASAQALAAIAHARWEAAEAAEEEMQLLEGKAQLESYGALRDFVRESLQTYAHIDDSPREWRWLPVDLLWGAAPLTKGLIKDPFHILSRRLQAAHKKGQNGNPQEATGQDSASAVLPFLDGLLHSPFPCACRHIDSWRWRAVGVTAFFGPFGDQHGAFQAQVDVGAHGGDGAVCTTRSHSRTCASELHELQQGTEGMEALEEGKRLRRDVKRIFTALLQDVLQFTGIHAPDFDPAAGELSQESTEGTLSLGPSGPTSNFESERPGPEGNSRLGDPDNAKGEAALCSSDTHPDIQGPPQQAASSIACFARQQRTSEDCPPRARYAARESRTSDPDPASEDCHSGSEGGKTRHEWRAFARRLVAAAAKKVVKARGACASGRCRCGAGSGAEPYGGSKAKCAWRSFIWSECRKLLHSYLAAASSHTTTLRLALPRLPSKKKRKKRQQTSEAPLSTEPLPPTARQDFLRRVMDAYLSSHWASTDSQTRTEAKFTCSPPAEKDVVNDSTDNDRGDQTPKEGETQDRGGEDDPGLWTPEEVLHWQLGCSMWCNSALRLLSAHHLAPLLQLHSWGDVTRGVDQDSGPEISLW